MIGKEWKYYTEEEITANKKRLCLNCKYGSRIYYDNNLNGLTCDYFLITGKLRDCSPIGCIRFEKKNGKRKRTAFGYKNKK